MPILTKRLAQGIYYHQWMGNVLITEVLEAFETEMVLFHNDDIEKYVAILDGKDVKTLPINIPKLTEASSGHELITLIYKPPKVAYTLGKMVSKLVNIPVEFYNDWDETIARANQLIEQYQATIVE